MPDVAETQRMKRSSGLPHMDFLEESRQAIVDMRNVPTKWAHSNSKETRNRGEHVEVKRVHRYFSPWGTIGFRSNRGNHLTIINFSLIKKKAVTRSIKGKRSLHACS